MSTNAAFADGVPAVPCGLLPGERSAPHAHRAPTGSPDDDLARWYAEQRRWPARRDAQGRLWLEAGADFDVIDVPREAGRQAVRRLIGYGQAALTPGPVASAEPDRCRFFVAPGARDDLPELLDWLDWGGIDLGMRALGAGDRLPAPARDRWLHDPLAVPPEVIALLATIAESCSRYALTRRSG
ncbi:MAG: hypothetical protein ACRET5_17250 [Steroidobacteraceae bacterium]